MKVSTNTYTVEFKFHVILKTAKQVFFARFSPKSTNGWRRISTHQKDLFGGFSGGSVVKNPPANAGNMNLIPGPGRSPMLGNN